MGRDEDKFWVRGRDGGELLSPCHSLLGDTRASMFTGKGEGKVPTAG